MEPAPAITRKEFLLTVGGAALLSQSLPAQTDIGKILIFADAGAYGAAIRLLLLTAQRREKILSMPWGDIGKDGTWTIRTAPREKGNPGALQLPKQALAILKAIPRFVGNDQVFASNNGRRFVFNHTRRKAALDRASGVRDWRVHDLRRTGSTLLNELGFNSDWIEKCLAHEHGRTVRGVYNKAEYEPQRRHMLQEWANMVDAWIAGDKYTAVFMPPAVELVAHDPHA